MEKLLGKIVEWILDLLGDGVKSRLKPDEPPEAIKKRVLKLYKVILEVNQATISFEECFNEYVPLRMHSKRSTEYGRAKSKLTSTVYRLTRLLPDLSEALKSVNPHLEIYEPDIDLLLMKFTGSRAIILMDVEDLVEREKAKSLDLEELSQRIRQNTTRIIAATESF
jgi:hypothetical protein